MRELAPECFQFGNHGADIPFECYVNNDKLLTFLKNSVIVGYNYKPTYKPEPDYVAVMILEDENEYWTHIPIGVFEKLKDEL